MTDTKDDSDEGDITFVGKSGLTSNNPLFGDLSSATGLFFAILLHIIINVL